MAYFDTKSKTIVRSEPYVCEQYPKWDVLDCGCCGGLEWGGEYPRECQRCGGGGVIFRHRKSAALAMYPGGPFIGQWRNHG